MVLPLFKILKLECSQRKSLLFSRCYFQPAALAETDTEIPLPATDVKISEERLIQYAVDSIPIPDEMTYALDHMLSSWYQDKCKEKSV